MYIIAFILCDGGWNPSCWWMFSEDIYFWITKLNTCGLSEIHVLFTLQSVFLLLLWLFFQCYTPFCFLRIWNIVLNGWNSYCLWSDHCFRYSVNVSAKVDRTHLLMLCIDGLFIISSTPPEIKWMIVIEWLSCLW